MAELFDNDGARADGLPVHPGAGSDAGDVRDSFHGRDVWRRGASSWVPIVDDLCLGFHQAAAFFEYRVADRGIFGGRRRICLRRDRADGRARRSDTLRGHEWI